ncbi:uncharacterized protein LOC118195039 [Stegodyphus dumicola]|uniref:uncharacterized protein LOC118195039 n=1 Tax=Stegodyphus dumicola TaxID=202533 RepID=UPI0015AEEDBB|nr:uncharacterized protein LOC118195039 [Stegodyphus dumicola]
MTTGCDSQDLKPLFKLSDKSRDLVRWVVSCTPKAFKSCLKHSQILLGWISCKIREFYGLKRCYNCQDFGHTNRDCKLTNNKNKQIRCLQINLQKAQSASAQSVEFALTQATQLLLQEPYTKNGKLSGFPRTWNIIQKEDVIQPPRAAIICCNQNWTPYIIAAERDQVAILLEIENISIIFISIYSSPTEDLTATFAFLEKIFNSTNIHHQIICGDFNAHNITWGYASTNPKGRNLEDFISSKNLFIHNTIDAPPTFDNSYAIGWPDLTLTTPQMAPLIQNWAVEEEQSLSDHKFITFQLEESTSVPVIKRYTLPKKQNSNTL